MSDSDLMTLVYAVIETTFEDLNEMKKTGAQIIRNEVQNRSTAVVLQMFWIELLSDYGDNAPDVQGRPIF
ncbi:hypothetical protein KIN20_022465 [Parelaphostrongylus tenuis]|uniref:Uncharacterized protein n=1 Tax=Parelaphostrongylus tenuis TaxID=148309 RepID=A0AAD5QSA4_PARTN|nr:hypothetical protein KIN20_022465 [Parelaphostrongylus tenuis]